MDISKNLLHDLTANIFYVDYVKSMANWSTNTFYTPSFSSIGLMCVGTSHIVVNGVDLYPKEGQLYLLPANTLQFCDCIPDIRFEKYYCHFNVKSNNNELFSLINLPLCVDAPDFEKVKAIFSSIMEENKKNSFQSIIKVKSLILELVNIYIEACGTNDLNVNLACKTKSIQKSLDYINDNLHSEISIDTLAQITNFHPNYFSKQFKQVMGMAPNYYINKCRMDRAISLLIFSQDSIGDIAERTGFKSQFYFSKSFKKYFGITPKSYRDAFGKKR